MIGRILFLVLFIVITDVLLYLVILKAIESTRIKALFKKLQVISVLTFLGFSAIVVILFRDPGENYHTYRYYFLWMDALILFYLPKLALLLFLMPLFLPVIFKFKRKRGEKGGVFYIAYKYFWLTSSVFFALLIFFVSVDGMITGVSRFRVNTVSLRFKNLPPAFDGFKVALFSDIHLGSWFITERVEEGLNLLKQQKTDVILFSGDLINVMAEETNGYELYFRQLSAPYGKYAVLGNHDMGDFARLHRDQYEGKEVPMLESFYADQDFILLRNSHSTIRIGKDSIFIAGTDNWSASHFKKFGDLKKTLNGIPKEAFTILLSHDPSHWRKEILPDSGVELTVSGHTHGGQMGIVNRFVKWSPVEYLTEEWNGLYQEGQQYLYVNPGFGFIGFSGRIGILPQITVITLYRR